MRSIFAVVVAFGLAGCAANQPAPVHDPAAAGPYPDNYKPIVATYVRAHFFDPYSLRDVKISQPVRGWTAMTGTGLLNRGENQTLNEGWLVCVELNARNRQGGYTGLSRTMFLIHDGVVVESDSNGPEVCNDKTVLPWPEMENIGATQSAK